MSWARDCQIDEIRRAAASKSRFQRRTTRHLESHSSLNLTSNRNYPYHGVGTTASNAKHLQLVLAKAFPFSAIGRIQDRE